MDVIYKEKRNPEISQQEYCYFHPSADRLSALRPGEWSRCPSSCTGRRRAIGGVEVPYHPTGVGHPRGGWGEGVSSLPEAAGRAPWQSMSSQRSDRIVAWLLAVAIPRHRRQGFSSTELIAVQWRFWIYIYIYRSIKEKEVRQEGE